MVSRSPRIRRPLNEARLPAQSHLTYAKWLLTCENFCLTFAKPLLLSGFFVGLAWLGVFQFLFPWLHILALALFVAALFEALAKSHEKFKPPTAASAKRRLEEANGLHHRPFDVLSDQPAAATDEQRALWRLHVERSKAALHDLRFPRWNLSFDDKDPYALRYAVGFLLVISFCFASGSWGERLLQAFNPALGSSFNAARPTLDAWISPPEYTGLPPVMIATPAGLLADKDVIEVPEGSTITAHLAEQGGDAPVLSLGGTDTPFAPDDHQDYGLTAPLTSGDTLSIRRGWRSLGSWHVRLVPNVPPKIALAEPPSVTEQKSIKLSWEASDAYGVAKVKATVTPRESLPGASDKPVELDLASPQSKDVKRVSYEDLTASPWAGLSVRIQLTATDAAGLEAMSQPADLILPERVFFNVLARTLIAERKKLLEAPLDEIVHNEAANVMAGMAITRVSELHGDTLILLALRAGAVRLILDRTGASIPSVTDILWQTALRIEEGNVSSAERNLREAQKDLADALDHGAGQAEIQQKIKRLHDALAQYLSQLAMRGSSQGPMMNQLEQALGNRGSALSAQDLDHMLSRMRDLTAAGAKDAAREELAKLQQMLEGLRTDHAEMTPEQKKAIQTINALRELAAKQKQLLEETFREGQSAGAQNSKKLALQEDDISHALKSLLDGSGDDSGTDDLNNGEQEMKGASADLNRGAPRMASAHQNQALAALQKAIDKMADSLKSSMFMVGRQGKGSEEGEGYDPFGRSGLNSFNRDDGGVKVPDRMEARRVREILDELQRRAGDGDRSKTERDYIERLLQNF